MAPVDVDLIREIYDSANFALGEGKNAAITAALNCCGIPDPGFVGWVVGKILDKMGLDASEAALAIAVALEYAKRTNSIKKGLRLKNHCGLCQLKGHNAQNHPSEIDEFLSDIGLEAQAGDIAEVADAALGGF